MILKIIILLAIVSVIFTIFYMIYYVKGDQFKILLHGMTYKKAIFFVSIIVFIGGIILAPLAWYWLIKNAILKTLALKNRRIKNEIL